jgi:hypothetical protein
VRAVLQEQQITDPVPVLGEFAGTGELVLVSLRVICPDVLDLQAASRVANRVIVTA